MKVSSNTGAQAFQTKPEVATSSKNQQSIGDIANQVAGNASADKSRRIEGHGNPKLDKDAFFKLMLAQVKNQDPMNPLKEHEMAAQLAQFSSLEQMSNVKDILTDMNKTQASNGQYQSLELMGKYISGDSSKIDRNKGDKQHEISFDLKDAADVVQVTLKNANGETVKEFELSQQQNGPVKLNWDGVDKDGKVQPPGTYRVSIEAASQTKGKVGVDTQFKGQVTGVNFTDKGPILMVGQRAIALKDIKMIEMKENAPVDKAPAMAKKALFSATPTVAPEISQKANERPIDLAAFDGKNLNKNLENKIR